MPTRNRNEISPSCLLCGTTVLPTGSTTAVVFTLQSGWAMNRFALGPLVILLAISLAACGATAPLTSASPTAPTNVQSTTQNTATIPLTTGTVQLYAGDPGSAHLQ